MKNEIIFSLLNNIKESCEHGFLQINQRIDTLEETINKLEKKNIGGGPPSSNFSKIENKIDYLNEHVNHIEGSIFDFISKSNFINEESIFSILKEEQSMYNIIIQFLYHLYKEQEISFCYVFPFQKNTFYFWNQEKLSWDKMTQQILKNIFEIVQQKIIQLFNKLIVEKNPNLNHYDIVEKGSLLFANNFDQKYQDIKKSMFQQFI